VFAGVAAYILLWFAIAGDVILELISGPTPPKSGRRWALSP